MKKNAAAELFCGSIIFFRFDWVSDFCFDWFDGFEILFDATVPRFYNSQAPHSEDKDDHTNEYDI